MYWKGTFCIAIMAASSAFAFVEKTIDEKKPLEVVFSTSTHNRIAVEGGAVEKIYGDTSLFTVNFDSPTGNAFVNVVREIEERPAALTVVTSSGAVQDLLVRSFEGPSEQVLLKEEEGEEWVIRPIVSHSSTIDFLAQVVEGKIPAGYGERDWEEEEGLQLPHPLIVKPMKALEGPFETISVYKITNPEEKMVVLDPDALKNEKDSWVYLNAYELKEGMKAICIIGKVKDEI